MTKEPFQCGIYLHWLPGGKGKLCRQVNPSSIISPFSSPQASNAEQLHPSSLSQQRLHKIPFLQKLSCQKPYWDQVRLSSLVNKQVAPDKKWNTIKIWPNLNQQWHTSCKASNCDKEQRRPFVPATFPLHWWHTLIHSIIWLYFLPSRRSKSRFFLHGFPYFAQEKVQKYH